MSGKNGKRLQKLIKMAGPALRSTELVEIAKGAPSASQALKRALDAMYLEAGAENPLELARSCQALATIKTNFGREKFEEVLLLASKPLLGGAPMEKGKKGIKLMKPKSEVTEVQETQAAEKAETQETPPFVPLKKVEFRAAVRDFSAQVKITQVFENNSDLVNAEPVYIFPLPRQASVKECKVRIGKRIITTELKEREKARREYQQARAEGRHAALVEEELPQIFTMSLTGIRKGEEVKAELTYVQAIPYQDGGGRFTIHQVVPQIYIHGNPIEGKSGTGTHPDTDAVPNASRISPSVAYEGVPYTAEVSIQFSPGFRCVANSPTHLLLVSDKEVGKNETAEFKAENLIMNKDVILTYRSLSKAKEVSVQGTSREKDGKSFCVISVLPPGGVVRKPTDLVLLLDVSGSMDEGTKLEGTKAIAEKLAREIQKEGLDDRVAIVIFSGQSFQRTICPLGKISDECFPKIRGIRTVGDTYVGQALSYVFREVFDNSERQKAVLLISDGRSTDQAYSGSGARIYTIGIDEASDYDYLARLAERSGGAFHAYNPGESYDNVVREMLGMISGPILTNIKVRGASSVVGYPFAFNSRPAVVIAKFDGSLPKSVLIEGTLAVSSEQAHWEVPARQIGDCAFAGFLYGREAIREAKGAGERLQLSLEHGVLCAETAFVGILQGEEPVPGEQPTTVPVVVEASEGWNWGNVSGSGPSVMSALPMVRRLSRSGGRMDHLRGYGFAPDHGIGIKHLTGGLDENDDVDHLDSFFADPDDEPAELNLLDVEEIDGPNDLVLEHRDHTRGATRSAKSPKPSSLSPFDIKSKDLAEGLGAVLVACNKGNYDIARKAFNALALDKKTVAKLSEIDAAKVFYFGAMLKKEGFSLKGDILISLATREFTHAEAKLWHAAGLARLGQRAPFNKVALYQANFDGAEYLRWKLLNGPRPDNDRWAPVP